MIVAVRTEQNEFFYSMSFYIIVYPVYYLILLKDVADIDTVYDCCGKPIAELGLVKEDGKLHPGNKRLLDFPFL